MNFIDILIKLHKRMRERWERKWRRNGEKVSYVLTYL